MKQIEELLVKYHDKPVGKLTLTPDGRLCAFEYTSDWLDDGFSLSPLELPLKRGIFVAKGSPFNGNFGIFEDSLPDGYGRYLLSRALKRQGISDSDLNVLHRLSIVGERGMGALTFSPVTSLSHETYQELEDFDLFQQIEENGVRKLDAILIKKCYVCLKYILTDESGIDSIMCF